jgi:hypothetical protein
MSERTYAYFTALIAAVCGWVVIHRFFFPASLTLRSALVQGVLIGWGLAVVTVEIIARLKATRVNGWITIYGCGEPGNGMFLRAACTRIFPGPVNSPREAIYWRTQVDGAGQVLSGERNYILRFPPGGLPPVNAFWSLTMAELILRPKHLLFSGLNLALRPHFPPREMLMRSLSFTAFHKSPTPTFQ